MGLGLRSKPTPTPDKSPFSVPQKRTSAAMSAEPATGAQLGHGCMEADDSLSEVLRSRAKESVIQLEPDGSMRVLWGKLILTDDIPSGLTVKIGTGYLKELLKRPRNNP